jgi:hypothetical protein
MRGCAGDQRSDIKEQCFCENRCPVSLKRRKIAGNSRLKGASWSKFVEFADEFTAIRAAELAEKLHQRSPAQPHEPNCELCRMNNKSNALHKSQCTILDYWIESMAHCQQRIA